MAVQEFVYGTLLLETERTAARLLNSGGPLPLGRRQVGKTFPHGHKPGGFFIRWRRASPVPNSLLVHFTNSQSTSPLPGTPRALATARVKTGRSGRVSFSGRGTTLDSGPLGQQMLDPPQCPLSASVRPYGRGREPSEFAARPRQQPNPSAADRALPARPACAWRCRLRWGDCRPYQSEFCLSQVDFDPLCLLQPFSISDRLGLTLRLLEPPFSP